MSILLRLAFCLVALPAQAERVTVFAAASLKTALDEIAADWQAATGDEIAVSYGGSALMERQIIAGAPADIFISAAPDWMDAVEVAGRLAPGTRVDLLGNDLVLIGPAGATDVDLGPDLDLAGLLGGGRLAMGQRDSVPAGQYGMEALQTLGLWTSVEGQLAETDNVRAALALVASGEAPYGITYASDAVAEPRVRVVAVFPEDSHRPITYPAALIPGATDAAAAFLAALERDEASEVLERNGFKVLP